MASVVEHIPRIPFTAFLVGCSGSGKTVFYTNLLKNWDNIFDIKIGKLIIVYGFFQKAYEELHEIFGDKCQFATDLCDDILEGNGVTDNECTVLVLDDVAHRICDNELLVKLFIGASHHKRIVCLFVTQNLFASRSTNYITIQRNTNLVFLFRLPRDQSAIRVLGRQLFPEKNGSQVLSQAYQAAMDSYAQKYGPFGYLMVDCQIRTPDNLRLRTGLLPWESPSVYYVLNK